MPEMEHPEAIGTATDAIAEYAAQFTRAEVAVLAKGLEVLLCMHTTSHQYNCTCSHLDPYRAALLHYKEQVNQ